MGKSTVIVLISTVLLAAFPVRSQTTIGANVVLDPQDISVLVQETKDIQVRFRGQLTQNVQFNFSNEHSEFVTVTPSVISVDAPSNGFIDKAVPVKLQALSPGQFDLVGKIIPAGLIDDAKAFIRVTIANSTAIIYVSIVIGWIYFVAWTISFWPQMIINFRRKSVVGLSFDFLAMNLLGHTLYAIFNCSLYWNDHIEQEYFNRNPRGLNPVIANDVAFSLHASLATFLTVVQCFLYERGEQRVSYTAQGILGVFATIIVVSGILVGTETWHWLDFLYALSYIKLAITLIKYVPQAVLNFRRKSTVGWSIENILLDFTGGMLSMLQMLLNAYNYDDWASIFGDPTKFGLGLFSVLFDIVFIVQHYVLYKDSEYVELPGDNHADYDPGTSHLPTTPDPVTTDPEPIDV
ncbi:AAEL006113-PB [Aedes aegypti]|uniref:Cystinosin homolog n=2 Tax=Aedes aegypti TaxID=7159 RepID=Q177J0_AEDAE|nr:cystinosin homolog isoform X1 [Aedes aegypti]XP_021693409.1 cystinosin homolog isoform X1 [Aedes aegypti]XP_021693410.1 cystinosin homolog isoform X1 [Aedes aegypti]XP_021693411.1 cystinosin homolog isoform X1 [Aedes aegypti]XP_021693412.1 cystinosin homolog isoform X1 [Aedes aegypti]XP_021693413.1 cystinosin homolog isoform X1 [Aedes aegypti]XP_021693414.1 cystinosin homolog isoform X1 [Aedes aegypti]EAT42338.1 AAEL006113-PB [Aedes aegypti]